MKSKKEEERKEEKKKRKKKEEKSKRYGFLWVFVDYFGYLYRFLWICMEKKNQTINQFLMNLDLKEPYLVYWLCFGLWLVNCNPQLRNICIKEILGF